MRSSWQHWTRRSRGRPRRPGVSFIELLMVITLVAVLTGMASIYYRGMTSEANRERARTDLRELSKGILKLETDQKVTIRPYPYGPHPYMEPANVGVNDLRTNELGEPIGFDFERLLDFRIMSRIPEDPWGMPYVIDIPSGTLLSGGEDAAPFTGDDVVVRFRPPFTPQEAHLADGRRAVVVEFSRKIDPFSLFAPTPGQVPFSLQPAGAGIVTTAARHITNPFAAVVRLQAPIPPGVPNLRIQLVSNCGNPLDAGDDTGIQAMDTACLQEIPTGGVPVKDY